MAAENALGSPTHFLPANYNGLMRKNAEFQIVVESGELFKVNNISHPDLFYALHGGGAGSWGVLVSATVHTFPTFNATFSLIVLSSPFTPALGTLTAVHAQHIFDLNPVRGGQYFYLQRLAPNGTAIFLITTFLPNMSVEAGTALMQPFLAAARVIPEVTVGAEAHANEVVNDLPFQVERPGSGGTGVSRAVGGRGAQVRLFRVVVSLGQVLQWLMVFIFSIYGHLVAGGQVLANAHISSALHPAWRTAKVHLLLINTWSDSVPLATINAVRTHFLDVQLPILAQIAGSGPDAATYSNEADVLEVDFQATFFGPNYAKLSAIKDLFIVGAGVGSERWDQLGICTVYNFVRSTISLNNACIKVTTSHESPNPLSVFEHDHTIKNHNTYLTRITRC
ncbi:hypothetical protein C8J57DRAFT_1096210 [Mycena rebaudengoi]|nr:hypothetical protein C8J57DRAFT_1096210 [Mycena rebaudengoi]